MICRLLDASAGKILFDGESIGTIPARDFHRSGARVRPAGASGA
jgi:peptide/nickel transport system ATP-binding protein